MVNCIRTVATSALSSKLPQQKLTGGRRTCKAFAGPGPHVTWGIATAAGPPSSRGGNGSVCSNRPWTFRHRVLHWEGTTLASPSGKDRRTSGSGHSARAPNPVRLALLLEDSHQLALGRRDVNDSRGEDRRWANAWISLPFTRYQIRQTDFCTKKKLG